MLDNRAIAFDGIGQPLPLLARDGLWPVEEEQPPTEQTVFPTGWPRRKRTKRARREEETILFLMRR